MGPDTLETIRRCHLFSGADATSHAALAQASRKVRLRRGGTLFVQGDEPDGLYMVLSGLIRIWISDAEGRELTLALLEPGEVFGEIALLDGLPRSANATAIEASECLLTPAAAFSEVLGQDHQLAIHLIELLCEMLRRNNEAIGAFAFLGLDGRLAQKLLELAMAHAVQEDGAARFTRRFSQTDLAQMLGVSREAVNKRLSIFAHDGLVVQSDGVFEIPDLSALSARATASAGLAKGR